MKTIHFCSNRLDSLFVSIPLIVSKLAWWHHFICSVQLLLRLQLSYFFFFFIFGWQGWCVRALLLGALTCLCGNSFRRTNDDDVFDGDRLTWFGFVTFSPEPLEQIWVDFRTPSKWNFTLSICINYECVEYFTYNTCMCNSVGFGMCWCWH